jgi:hypothetical protein
MKVRPFLIPFAVLVFAVSTVSFAIAQKTSDSAPPKEGILTSAEVGTKLFPDRFTSKASPRPCRRATARECATVTAR